MNNPTHPKNIEEIPDITFRQIAHSTKETNHLRVENPKEPAILFTPESPSGLFENPKRGAEKTKSFFRQLGVDYCG